MDDSEFLRGLKQPEDRQQEWTDSAEAFIRLRRQPAPIDDTEKTAGMAQGAVDYAKNSVKSYLHGLKQTGTILKNPESDPYLLPTTLGTGALTYAGSRPMKSLDGKSAIESGLGWMADRQKEKEETGLGQKVKNRGTEFMLGLAKAMREHPVKASLTAALGAPTGLSWGLSKAKMRGLHLPEGHPERAAYDAMLRDHLKKGET